MRSHTLKVLGDVGMRTLLRRGPVWLAVQMGAVGAVLYAGGRFEAVAVPDTPGYVNYPFGSLAEALGYYRTPAYPVFLRICQLASADLRWIPVGHYVCYCVAVAVFFYGLRALSRSELLSTAGASSLLYANILHGYVSFVATDSLAAAAGITTIGILLHRVEGSAKWSSILLLGFAVSAAWLLRPAYLFLVVLVPVLGSVLRATIGSRDASGATWCREFFVLVLTTAVPLLSYCGARWLVIGSFGIVSFGGYNLIGIAGQFLDSALVEELPADLRPMARAALEEQRRREAEGAPMADADRRNYMRMELRYDMTIWRVFTPAAQKVYGDDHHQVNTQLRRLAVSIIRARPYDYALWLVKSLRQALRKIVSDFVVNPVYFVLTLAAVGAQLLHTLLSETKPHDDVSANAQQPNAVGILFVVSVSYAASKLLLVVFVCPPIGRMTDAMWVFLPAVAVAVFVDRATRIHRLLTRLPK